MQLVWSCPHVGLLQFCIIAKTRSSARCVLSLVTTIDLQTHSRSLVFVSFDRPNTSLCMTFRPRPVSIGLRNGINLFSLFVDNVFIPLPLGTVYENLFVCRYCIWDCCISPLEFPEFENPRWRTTSLFILYSLSPSPPPFYCPSLPFLPPSLLSLILHPSSFPAIPSFFPPVYSHSSSPSFPFPYLLSHPFPPPFLFFPWKGWRMAMLPVLPQLSDAWGLSIADLWQNLSLWVIVKQIGQLGTFFF